MEQMLKDVLTEREHWNYFDWSRGSARIGLVAGETCFVPYTLAMKKMFPSQNLPIGRVIRPGIEIKFSQVLCKDKFFLNLIGGLDSMLAEQPNTRSEDFPWDLFMRIIEVTRQYFVVERKNYHWKIDNLALTYVKEIFLRGLEKA